MSAQTTVPILHKAIRVLEALAGDTACGSIQQLAKASAVPTTSCFRIVNTLETERWIAKPGPGQPSYRLSTGLLPLLGPLQRYQQWRDRVQPTLQTLALQTGLSAKLSVREGNEAVTIARAEPTGGMAVTNSIGSRFAIVIGATGAALLMGLDKIELDEIINISDASCWQHQTSKQLRTRIATCKRTGLCKDDGSYHPQIGAWAAPVILDENTSAAITITGLADDLKHRSDKTLRSALREAIVMFANQCDTHTSMCIS